MYIIGINGGFTTEFSSYDVGGLEIFHDSSAALLKDGKILYAIEEERLSRIKHSNKTFLSCVKFCLHEANITIDQVNQIAFYCKESSSKSILAKYNLNYDGDLGTDYRDILYQHFQSELPGNYSKDIFVFVPHHEAHSEMAYHMSGYQNCLSLVIDGTGDSFSGIVQTFNQHESEILKYFSIGQSLGHFYLKVIRYLGYELFDEYKVMGLAPYGNVQTYSKIFNKLYKLLPQGDYIIFSERIDELLFSHIPIRKKGGAILQEHKDLAASLQEALANIVLHILRHYQAITKMNKLCLSGGVANNSAMNGIILQSGLFDSVFVSPASHDSGCAVGGAYYCYKNNFFAAEIQREQHVYWGSDIGTNKEILEQLKAWENYLSYKKYDNITDTTADLLAADYVVSWVQGRSEFGPRALGNRSILADPRKSSNKQRINQMIKKREDYRPFAPSVLEEYLHEYFECNEDHLPYMSFVVPVKSEKAEMLGAITHVDGTARVQSVSSKVNPRFWALIKSFQIRTGIPILLNTSFNNNSEPIVDSVFDAITCFLTTNLNYMVINDYLIRKKDKCIIMDLVLEIPQSVVVDSMYRYINSSEMKRSCYIMTNYNSKKIEISRDLYELLLTGNRKTIRELISALVKKQDRRIDEGDLTEEICSLWEKRLLSLYPY